MLDKGSWTVAFYFILVGIWKTVHQGGNFRVNEYYGLLKPITKCSGLGF